MFPCLFGFQMPLWAKCNNNNDDGGGQTWPIDLRGFAAGKKGEWSASFTFVILLGIGQCQNEIMSQLWTQWTTFLSIQVYAEQVTISAFAQSCLLVPLCCWLLWPTKGTTVLVCFGSVHPMSCSWHKIGCTKDERNFWKHIWNPQLIGRGLMMTTATNE